MNKIAMNQLKGTSLTTVDMLTEDMSDSTTVVTKGYSATTDKGAATWVRTGTTTPGSSGTIDYATGMLYDSLGNEFSLHLPNGVLNINQLGMFADTPVGGGTVTDHTVNWQLIIESQNFYKIYMPKVDGYSYRMQLFKVKADSEVFGDGLSLTKGTVIELFYTGSHSVVMGQINDNTYVHDLRVASTEPDLAWQRLNVSSASNVTLERIASTGFRDVTGAADSWGMYVSESNNIRIIDCAFDDNTQSDIAIVDSNTNVTVSGCYSESASLYINFEPNGSTAYNKNITLSAMDMAFLDLLEVGSGGTANTNITINSCTIGRLFYNGASAVFTNCEITSFFNGTNKWAGPVEFINTLALSPNLLEDPYMINNGFDLGNATADNNAWYMVSRTGAITTNQLSPLIEDGVRFSRINPTSALGTVLLETVATIPVAAGEYYLVAITGRNGTGSSGAYAQVNMASNFSQLRVFRQSNLANPHWSTEIFVVEAKDTETLRMRIGLWTTNAEHVDIHAVTVHKILGNGNSEKSALSQYHENIIGPRELPPVAAIPVIGSTDMNGVLTGDRLSLSTTGVQYYFNGTAWTAV